MATKSEVIQLVKYLAAGYPGVRLADEIDEVYFQKLGHLPMEILQKAADMCLDECKYFPTIADIRTMLSRLAQETRDTRQDAPRQFVPPPEGLEEKMNTLFKRLGARSAKRERKLG